MDAAPTEVTLQNADAVYDFYREHRQQPWKAKAMYGVLAVQYRPRVRYVGRARAALRRLTGSRVPLIVAANHVRETDPFILAASGFLSPLRPAIGRMRVLAKDELFEDPDQRRKIDDLGGIPVFRPKDHGMRAAAAAGGQMMGVCADRMSRGDSIAIFPEGTCNDGDPGVLQKLSSGVGHIAVRAQEAGSHPWLVCAGIAYPESGRPTVVFSEPVDLGSAPSSTPAAVTRDVAARLQDVVSLAVDR